MIKYDRTIIHLKKFDILHLYDNISKIMIIAKQVQDLKYLTCMSLFFKEESVSKMNIVIQELSLASFQRQRTTKQRVVDSQGSS